jgi:hypothetical protein
MSNRREYKKYKKGGKNNEGEKRGAVVVYYFDRSATKYRTRVI